MRYVTEKFILFTKLDKGTKTVLFQDITSVDLDIGTVYNYVVLTMAGSPGVTLQQPDKGKIQKFYDLLHHKIDTYKSNMNTQQKNTNNNSLSDTEELLRWNELKEKGIITEEEFERKKKEILGF